MNVFENYAEKYLEMGYSVVPVETNTKKPSIYGWTTYAERLPTMEEIEKWMRMFGQHNIGIIMGPASGIVGFDYDYDYNKEKVNISEKQFGQDKFKVESEILNGILPESPAKKRGKKGWTSFYRYNDGLKNLSCNRHGVTCFDFLVNKRNCVVPPSVHADTGFPYQWIEGDLLSFKPSEIPEISMEAIVELSDFLNSSGRGTKLGGRHGSLFKYALDIMDIIKTDDDIVERMVAQDISENGDKAYLSDRRHFPGGASAHDNARNWLKRIKTFKNASGAIKGGGAAKSKAGYYAYEAFFDTHLGGAKKDLISKKLMRRDSDGVWQPVINDVKAIRSYAEAKGLKKADIEDNFDRYALEKKPELLIDIPEWDGVDRIATFTDYLKISNCRDFVFEDLVKDWGAGVFRRLFDNEEQNRCIILKGGQGKGKDSFIRSFLRGFGPYYTKFSVFSQEKDYWNLYSKKLVVHIEEFDTTHNVSLGLLKQLITRDFSEFRAAYGRDDELKVMRCSFFSSVNFDDFLRDPTGNRRFAVFDVEDISWEYPDDWSEQIKAQFYSLYKAGYRAQKESVLEMAELVKKYEDIPLDSMVAEDFAECIRSKMRQEYGGSKKQLYRYDEIKHEVIRISKDYKLRPNTVLKIVGRYGMKTRDAASTLYGLSENIWGNLTHGTRSEHEKGQ